MEIGDGNVKINGETAQKLCQTAWNDALTPENDAITLGSDDTKLENYDITL